MSAPCSAAHQRRAAARPVKFAIVAPVVRTPPQLAGRPKSSLSQPTATFSSREPSGELTQLKEFWSRAEASQSGPRAQGGADQVGAQRSGGGPAGHEVEEARACGAGCRRDPFFGEQGQRLRRSVA